MTYAFANADWDYNWATGRVVDRDVLKGTAMGVSQSPEGFAATVYAGARFQLGSIVLGAEAAYTGGAIEDRSPSPVVGGDDVNITKISGLTRVVGSLGLAHGSWLAYANGGFATAKVTTSFSDTVGPPRSQGSASDTHDHDGWTVGGGLEYRIAENLAVGAEYSYVELERQTHNKFVATGSLNTGRAVDDVAPTLHLFMARVTYRLPTW